MIENKYGESSLTDEEKGKGYNLLDSVERPDKLIWKIPEYARFTYDPKTNSSKPSAYIKSLCGIKVEL